MPVALIVGGGSGIGTDAARNLKSKGFDIGVMSSSGKGEALGNVLPGFIDSLPEKQDRVDRIPAGRYAKVEELSEVIAFLASDASSYVTGQNIRVDGGLTHAV